MKLKNLHKLTLLALISGSLFCSQTSTKSLLDNVAKPSAKPDLALSVLKTNGFVLKNDFLREIKNLFKATTFIETGTYIGQTTLAASAVFDEVYTVELSTALYDSCSQLFEEHKNIHLYPGTSPEFLQTILPQVNGQVIFWLDAHDSLGITARGDKETPIVEELRAIQESPVKDGIILIDDVRQFYKTGSDYPTFSALCQLIIDINPNYKLAVLGDVLIAFPESCNITVSPLVWALTLSRLYDENSNLAINIVAVDRIIAHAQGHELAGLEWIVALPEEGLGHGSYRWWYGLSRLYKGDTAQGIAALQTAWLAESKKQRLALLVADCLKGLNNVIGTSCLQREALLI